MRSNRDQGNFQPINVSTIDLALQETNNYEQDTKHYDHQDHTAGAPSWLRDLLSMENRKSPKVTMGIDITQIIRTTLDVTVETSQGLHKTHSKTTTAAISSLADGN